MTLNNKSREFNLPTRIWRFLTGAHPSITDVGEQRRAQLLSALSLIITIFFIWGIISTPTTLATFYVLLSVTLLAYIFSRTKYFSLGAYFFSFGFTSLAYLPIFMGTANSIDSSISSIVPISLILASAILSHRGFLVFAVATVIATIGVGWYADPRYLEDPNLILGRTYGITLSIAAILFGIIAFRSSVEKSRLKELRDVNTALEDLTTNLEQHVNDRTSDLDKANQQISRRAAQLQTITELSETIAQLRDLNDLFPVATHLIGERFGFYHVGIFLVDGEKKNVILQAANSEGGKQMLARGHRLELGTGVVGYAAKTGNPRIALDVGVDAVFFDNPDLPGTRAEAALPLISRGETIGVLDVQSTEAGAFSDEDLRVLTALANQVSIAFENARLLTETRAALAQAQEVYNEFTRSEWTRAVSHAEQPGFRYQSGRIEILENKLLSPEIVSAVEKGQLVANPVNGSSEKRAVLIVPVKLRGEVIGILHVESENQSLEWQEDEISLVEAVAERAAFAMENARLFQVARRRASKEQLISQASAKIGSAVNIENILQTTAEELERVLGGSEVLIQFKSKESRS